jgi:hypothetical protein
MHSVVMVSLLPLPIKKCNIPQKHLDEHQLTNREVLKGVLRQVLHPLIFNQNTGAKGGYYKAHCANGNFRRWKLVLAA